MPPRPTHCCDSNEYSTTSRPATYGRMRGAAAFEMEGSTPAPVQRPGSRWRWVEDAWNARGCSLRRSILSGFSNQRQRRIGLGLGDRERLSGHSDHARTMSKPRTAQPAAPAPELTAGLGMPGYRQGGCSSEKLARRLSAEQFKRPANPEGSPAHDRPGDPAGIPAGWWISLWLASAFGRYP